MKTEQIKQKPKKKSKIDKADVKIYGNAAKEMIKEGNATNERLHRERAAKVQAGNKRMKDTLTGDKAKKAAKNMFSTSKLGRMSILGRDISKAASERKAEYDKNEKRKTEEFNRKAKADSERSNKELSKSAKKMGIDVATSKAAKKIFKNKAKEQIAEYQDLPKGWKAKPDGYVYDDLGAIVPESELKKYRRKTTASK